MTNNQALSYTSVAFDNLIERHTVITKEALKNEMRALFDTYSETAIEDKEYNDIWSKLLAEED